MNDDHDVACPDPDTALRGDGCRCRHEVEGLPSRGPADVAGDGDDEAHAYQAGEHDDGDCVLCGEARASDIHERESGAANDCDTLRDAVESINVAALRRGRCIPLPFGVFAEGDCDGDPSE